MAIDVIIKQKLFGNKSMPLRVILGDDLQYGIYEGERLETGKLGGGEFIAYNPYCVGRGFSVSWKPDETKEIALRLPIPSTKYEIKDFYSAVERMVNHWGGSLTVDGSKVSLSDFLSDLERRVEVNNDILNQISSGVINGEHGDLVLYSAMWPLTMGMEEARRFLGDPEYYAWWLHKNQTVDACFESPRFYYEEGGICGKYMLMSDLVAIFPNKPTVPLGAIDYSTGRPIECKKWSVIIAADGKVVCDVEYSEFLELIPKEKICRFDGARFLLSEMTEEEIMALADHK
ncbi:MAG: DUF4299 family protein [Clostridia bacterium]|nr:DUF4299 family protein [Clostridia bacterium]